MFRSLRVLTRLLGVNGVEGRKMCFILWRHSPPLSYCVLLFLVENKIRLGLEWTRLLCKEYRIASLHDTQGKSTWSFVQNPNNYHLTTVGAWKFYQSNKSALKPVPGHNDSTSHHFSAFKPKFISKTRFQCIIFLVHLRPQLCKHHPARLSFWLLFFPPSSKAESSQAPWKATPSSVCMHFPNRLHLTLHFPASVYSWELTLSEHPPRRLWHQSDHFGRFTNSLEWVGVTHVPLHQCISVASVHSQLPMLTTPFDWAGTKPSWISKAELQAAKMRGM